MKCPHCGQEHPDNFQFCLVTGRKIKVQQEALKACANHRCPDFGKHIFPPDSRFCPTCGQPLERETGNGGSASDSSEITDKVTDVEFVDYDDYSDAKKQYYKGLCYENGRGVNQDYTEAVRWYRKAAEQGDADAQWSLGLCYENGQGVNQDYTEAVRWYRKAAEQGDADAQRFLGLCYENGRGVNRDCAEAVKWYTKAAEQGDRYAQKRIDSLSFR